MPTVASLDPANAAKMIWRNQPVTVRLQRSDSNDLVTLETTQSDFSSGTLTNVMGTSGNNLELLKQLLFDFEADTIGQLPSGWSSAEAYWTVQSKDSGKSLRCQTTSGQPNEVYPDAGAGLNDIDVYADFQIFAGGAEAFLSRWNGQTWASGHENAYRFLMYETMIRLCRVDQSGADNVLQTYNMTITANTWYTIHLQSSGSTHRARVWLRGQAEPGTWYLSQVETTYPTGRFGIQSGTGGTTWIDNVRMLNLGTTYATSGNRVSPAYSLATVAIIGGTYAEWTADVPSGTTLTVEASVNGTTWYALTNGAPIPTVLQEGDNVAAVSLYLRESMTGNGTNTPTLHDVTITFRPVEPRSVEVVVNGVSCTVANGLLCCWNTKIKSGSALVDCFKDVYFGAVPQWWTYGPASATFLVKYKGTTISTTTFDVEWWETFNAGMQFRWLATGIGGLCDKQMGQLFHYLVTPLEAWRVKGEYHYLVKEMPRGSHDFFYWVAHPFRSHFAGGAVVGQRIEQHLGGSAVVRGWQRRGHAGSAVIQGWQRGTNAGGAVVGRRIRQTIAAGGAIVGAKIAQRLAGSAVVYGVNRASAIDVQVVDEDEMLALGELGTSVKVEE